ncbi:hypothetical protein MPSEU_000769800 [Mayamaea pseudoterrestris]|nr:hypothetical protein MPSEU_000769800 [Mayamaea pseudoterrestris]
MGVRLAGTVKWFSAKKGFGFIAAKVKQGDAEEQEVFVHQTSILGANDGKSFRTLIPNATVEFEVEHDADTGKPKALNVTAPGGQPMDLPQRQVRRTRANAKDKEMLNPINGSGNATGKPKARRPKKKKDAAPKETPFHAQLSDEVRDAIKKKGLDLDSKGTVDVSIGDARVKLGLGQYAGLAHKDGIVAEGNYACDQNGLVSITWAKAIRFQDGSWQPFGTETLVKTIMLTEETVRPVELEETPELLWGCGKTDPREAFELNGFLMRRVVLTRPPRQAKVIVDATTTSD